MMTFSAELNAYCAALGCTSRDLAESSGISASTLSRYRSGKRTPNATGEPVRKLAAGIARMAQERQKPEVGTEQEILGVLTSGLQRGTETFSRKLDSLMSMLGISNVEMSRHSNVDPSYLSRIRNGKRSPAEPRLLAESCAEVIVRHAQEKGLTGTISYITGGDSDTLEGATASTVRWLLDEGIAQMPEGALFGREESDGFEVVVRVEPRAGGDATHVSDFDALEVAALAFVRGAAFEPGVMLRIGLSEACTRGDVAARHAWLRDVAAILSTVAEA